MKARIAQQNTKIALIIGGVFLASSFALTSTAQVMTSTNFKVERDSLNFGGGLSTSTSYSIESSAGEVGTGDLTGTLYKVRAGYQQLDTVFVSMSSVADVTLLPAIPSIGGGTGDGSTSVTITTDNSAGYELSIKASASPALTSGGSNFADYTPVGADPDFAFGIAPTTSAFGFSPEGTDIDQAFKDNGAACNAGALDTADSCWKGLSTSDVTIAESAAANTPTGTGTTLKFRAESGASNTQAAGTYSALITLTAVAL